MQETNPDTFQPDSIVQSVVEQFIRRAQFGKQKYGTDLDRNDLSMDEWLQHAQEEAMDFILYITKVRSELSGKKFCECSRTL
jgi:hypothetical protein